MRIFFSLLFFLLVYNCCTMSMFQWFGFSSPETIVKPKLELEETKECEQGSIGTIYQSLPFERVLKNIEEYLADVSHTIQQSQLQQELEDNFFIPFSWLTDTYCVLNNYVKQIHCMKESIVALYGIVHNDSHTEHNQTLAGQYSLALFVSAWSNQQVQPYMRSQMMHYKSVSLEKIPTNAFAMAVHYAQTRTTNEKKRLVSDLQRVIHLQKISLQHLTWVKYSFAHYYLKNREATH